MYGVDKNYSNGNRETIHPPPLRSSTLSQGDKANGKLTLIRSPLTVKRSPLISRQGNLEHRTVRVLAMDYVHHLGNDFGMLSCHILVLVNIL